MALEPLVLEMGLGIDLHGGDYTLAAKRAVRDAIQRNSLMFMRALGVGDTREMQVEVTLGIPQPDKVDQAEVLKTLPHGTGTLKVVAGGLEIAPRGDADITIMANAALVVKLDLK